MFVCFLFFLLYDAIPSINQLYYCYYYLLLLLLLLLLIFLFFLLIIDITIFVRYCFFSQCCYSSIVIKLTLLLLSLLFILLLICEFQPLKFSFNWQFFFALKRLESGNRFLFVHWLAYLFTLLLFCFLSCHRRLEIYNLVVSLWLP